MWFSDHVTGDKDCTDKNFVEQPRKQHPSDTAFLGCSDVPVQNRGRGGISYISSGLILSGITCAPGRWEGAGGGEGGGRGRQNAAAAVVCETQGRRRRSLQTLSSCKFIFIGLVVLLKGGEIHSAFLSFVSLPEYLSQTFPVSSPLADE